jgi:hypothetical protein
MITSENGTFSEVSESGSQTVGKRVLGLQGYETYNVNLWFSWSEDFEP